LVEIDLLHRLLGDFQIVRVESSSAWRWASLMMSSMLPLLRHHVVKLVENGALGGNHRHHVEAGDALDVVDGEDVQRIAIARNSLLSRREPETTL